MTMPDREYHIHVNAVGNIPPEIVSELSSLGFYYSDVTTDHDSGVPERLGIFTLKVQSHKDRDRIFAKALGIIQSNAEFRGYVESESSARQLIADIKFKPFDGSGFETILLPSSPMTNIGIKRADIHIYIPNEHASAALESFLTSHNFYRVQGKTKVNFTLALGSMRDAKEYYYALLNFFTTHGGASKIECEVVNDLKPANPYSRLRPVVPASPRTWQDGLNANSISSSLSK